MNYCEMILVDGADNHKSVRISLGRPGDAMVQH